MMTALNWDLSDDEREALNTQAAAKKAPKRKKRNERENVTAKGGAKAKPAKGIAERIETVANTKRHEIESGRLSSYADIY